MFQKVVLAVDGSKESIRAAALAEALAGQFRGEVVVLHVRETSYSGASSWSPEWTPDLEAYIADVVRRLNGDRVLARSEVIDAPRGHVGKVIADTASRLGADLIVVGSKGRSRDRWLRARERREQCGPVGYLPGPRGQLANRSVTGPVPDAV